MRLFKRRREICHATSPNGLWCTRQDRHTEHAAITREGGVHERWHGDHPYDPVAAWAPFIATLTQMMNAARQDSRQRRHLNFNINVNPGAEQTFRDVQRRYQDIELLAPYHRTYW